MDRVSRLLTFIYLISVLLSGCSEKTAEEALSTDEFVRWSADQDISYDMFLGSGRENAYSAYVGFYFIYDLHDVPDLRFNVTTFLDRAKSYASELNENSDSTKHQMFEKLYKLKFDHFEIYARKFRKHLIENGREYDSESEEKIRALASEFFHMADSAWNKIDNEIKINNDYTEEHFRYLRKMIDLDLEAYKEFDDSRNNYDNVDN
jgi:hypothetical protein